MFPQQVQFNNNSQTLLLPQGNINTVYKPNLQSSQHPPTFSKVSFSHPAYPQNIQNTSRLVDPTALYRPLPQSVIYSQHPYYPPQNSTLPPQYLMQPVPVIRRHPQYDLNPNFDYESANLLCQIKIVESTIFCVICGIQYKLSQKQQHLQKHIRKNQQKPLNQEILHRVQEYHKKQNKKTYLTKPIVEPQEIDVYYDPNVYQLIQQIIYQDEEEAKKQAGIGQDTNNSFSIFDNNVSISHGNTLNINPGFDAQPNPFFKKHQNIEQPKYHVPQFQIPEPKIQNYNQQIPQKNQLINQNDHFPQSLNSYPINNISNLKQQSVPKIQPILNHNSIPVNKQKSARFQQSNRFQGFPPQQAARYVQNQPVQQYSGPYQIRAPSVDRSKHSEEVNISQFIREINQQSEPLVIENRSRLPARSEW